MICTGCHVPSALTERVVPPFSTNVGSSGALLHAAAIAVSPRSDETLAAMFIAIR
jgi:hypothetical protein